jgi:hypothetical protein
MAREWSNLKKKLTKIADENGAEVAKEAHIRD